MVPCYANLTIGNYLIITYISKYTNTTRKCIKLTKIEANMLSVTYSVCTIDVCSDCDLQ